MLHKRDDAGYLPVTYVSEQAVTHVSGLYTAEEARQLPDALKEEGVLVGLSGRYGNVLKIRPPLVFSKDNVDQLIAALDKVEDIVKAVADAAQAKAEFYAEWAGFSVPLETKSLVIEIDDIGMHEPVSKEKMFPVLGYITVDGAEKGIATARAMLDLMGKGHSAVIHANDPAVVARYGAALPVCRIATNTPGVAGSAGMTTNLTPGAVIGTGFFGRSSVDDNVGPKQLVQWTRVAYNKEPSVEMGDMVGAVAALEL